jgi:hypothetical protein
MMLRRRQVSPESARHLPRVHEPRITFAGILPPASRRHLMPPSIFVSSTFSDLQRHRQLVREAIGRLEYGSKAMEFFGALPETPKEECLSLVRSANVLSRGTPMPLDDAVDGLMEIDKLLIAIVERSKPELDGSGDV